MRNSAINPARVTPTGAPYWVTGVQPEAEPRIYRIVRCYFNKPSRTIRNNVTLTEAQAHCSREDTHGSGWFDGYDYMRGCRPREER